MDVLVLAIGRVKGADARSPEARLIERYVGRADAMARSVGLRGVSLTDRVESRASEPSVRKAEEARALDDLAGEAVRVVLDERGEDLTSPDWASLIAARRDGGARRLAFMLGGPDGHDPGLRARADVVLSLGRATWPHLLARAMTTEQIYRALTILAGHPYHRI